MNTRQKLTLGIAAIFMVTLTIIGVTYAYFVTRVETVGEEQTNAVVGTATIASIQYVEDSEAVVQMTNKIPGESETKTFGVENPNVGAKGTYDIILTTAVPAPGTDAATEVSKVEGKIPFVHTASAAAPYATSTATACYGAGKYLTRHALVADCYSGTYYDNITFTLYESDGKTLATDVNGDTYENVRVMHDAKAEDAEDPTAQPQVIGTFTVDGAKEETVGETTTVTPTTRNFVIKFTYQDAGADQNIENFAALNIKVDIQ